MKPLQRIKCFFIGHEESMLKSVTSYSDYRVEKTYCKRCGGVADKKIILMDEWLEMWSREFDRPELL
jgi:hypothetical protein